MEAGQRGRRGKGPEGEGASSVCDGRRGERRRVSLAERHNTRLMFLFGPWEWRARRDGWRVKPPDALPGGGGGGGGGGVGETGNEIGGECKERRR